MPVPYLKPLKNTKKMELNTLFETLSMLNQIEITIKKYRHLEDSVLYKNLKAKVSKLKEGTENKIDKLQVI